MTFPSAAQTAPVLSAQSRAIRLYTFAPADIQRGFDVFRAVELAYQASRSGDRAVLVVPPIAEEGDARQVAGRWREEMGAASAFGSATGAAFAAEFTALACDRVGLDAVVISTLTGSDLKALEAAVGAHQVAVVGLDDPLAFGPSSYVENSRPLRVGVAGLGVVGAGVAARLALEPSRYQLVSALVRDPSRPRAEPIPQDVMVTDLDAFFAAEPELVVDVLSSAEAGFAVTTGALTRGLGVASANKQAVVQDLLALHQLARDHGGRLAFSAAVGGGCPMIETVRAAAASGEVQSIEAVLNGTVNFLFDRMAEGVDFDAAMAEARAAGFAEEDPSADLDGHDAAAKIRILAQEAFGEAPEDADVPREPLDASARERVAAAGGVWRQLGRAWRDAEGVHAEVRLALAAGDELLSSTRAEGNVIRVRGRQDEASAKGRGAGRYPTTEAVMADLADLRAAVLGL